MKYLMYVVFGLGMAVGTILYRSIESGPIAVLTLIAVIVVTAIATTAVEKKTEKK